MDNNWKQDPRLMAMDPEKVSLLMEFAEKTAHTDQSQLMPHFLHICQEANAKGLQFTNSETALLVDILSCHMPEKDRKKLPFLKLAAGKCWRSMISTSWPLRLSNAEAMAPEGPAPMTTT